MRTPVPDDLQEEFAEIASRAWTVAREVDPIARDFAKARDRLDDILRDSDLDGETLYRYLDRCGFSAAQSALLDVAKPPIEATDCLPDTEPLTDT